MKKIIWKIGLVFIIAIAVSETSFILLAEAEENIPVYRALFISPWYGSGIGEEFEEGFAILEEALTDNGWNQSNIRKLYGEDITWDMINRSIEEIGENDTEYDTTLIVIGSHGGQAGFDTYNWKEIIWYYKLNDTLCNHLDSTVGLIINTCFSGGALLNSSKLKVDERVIITSCNSTVGDSPTYIKRAGRGFNSFADYCIGDDPYNPIGDGNGAVSMKELYEYIKFNWNVENNSLFWSGYPIINQSEYYPLQITFQNFKEGIIDQITSDTSDTATNMNICKDNVTGLDRRVAQEFQPGMENIAKVRICLVAEPGINSTIRVSIQGVAANGTPDGTDLVYADVPRSEIPDYKTYVSFNFQDDYPLDTEESYFIVIRTIQSDPGTNYSIKCYIHDCYPDTPGYDYSCWYYDNSCWTEYSEYDVQFVTYGKNPNMPPHTPIRPFDGPKEGYAYVNLEFNVTTTDIECDKVAYGLNGDGDDIKWDNNSGDYYNSGDIVKVNYMWETSGQKFLKVKAKDIYDNQGGWSDVWFVNILPNGPPNAPTITGPTGGKPGENNDYTFTSTDPDENDVKYFIDWGDNHTEWTDEYSGSGKEVTVSHHWNKKGTYIIKAKAVDIHGAESDLSEFTVKLTCNIVGYNLPGEYNQNIKNKITGTCFTMTANGIADSITAYIQTTPGITPKTKCLIYTNDESSTLIGTTEEKILNAGEGGTLVTFNFSEPKPELSMNTEYIFACWSNDTCNLSYDNATSEPGRYRNLTYGCPFSPMSWNASYSRNYSIFCIYTTMPEITNVSATPETVGFGYNITISADIDDNGCGMENVAVNITYPNNTSWNFTMNNTGNNTYEYVFSDTWLIGQYNYTIWAVDNSWSTNNSSEYSFNVTAQATISVCTIKDNYGNNETINLTDPPNNSPLIGYELLDNGDILHIWNEYDSYYFDTNSGIQLTNHYDEYWNHNVLMLGYYSNDQWNLIYRTDELSGFNKEIDTDNETYVNATLWKDLTYMGYNFRLAIRYHLGVDDNELTVIPYIKNLGQNIPYVLGFGWEMKDIRIDMTPQGDYINVNQTTYYLNQNLNNVYTDLTEAEFYLMENTTDTNTKSLYLKWNQSLSYKLQVKSREGEYNAPVTLFIKIGTLSADQEKYTEIYWYDADQVTYYFDSYDDSPFGEAWQYNPGYMVDGSISNYASTTINGDVELCDSNNCSGADFGTISKVELRICSYYTGYIRDTIIRPVFGGTTDGNNHPYQTPVVSGVWSPWFEITRDNNAPDSWSWIDIQNLDCDIVAENDPMAPSFTLYCSKVEVRVTYMPYTPPEITNPYPPNNGNGIPISPTLNITVTDAGGESMNITWHSNSSGSWQVFGTNNSIGNGTYHQTMNNASVNGQWWYWKLNVSDGTNYTESSVFKFYTGYQSKIVNTGSTDIKGYLQVQVQFYNNSSWVIADNTINETTMRTINASEQLGLDTIFNSLVNTNNLSGFSNGTYRIYAVFRDPDGNVLVCDNENELMATYEFTISYN